MGIKGLHKFLRNTCPDVFEDIHISEYEFKKVAIDISLYMYLYKSSYGEKWLRSFVKLIECLRKYELHCVFVFDGKPPKEKEEERKRRRQQREQNKEYLCQVEMALERYFESGHIEDILREFEKKIKSKSKRLLLLPSSKKINIRAIENAIKKKKSQLFDVTEEDFKLARSLFDILDVPYFTAPGEAETACSDLCKRKLVDAVLSRDSDVIAYGAPVFLTNINVDTGRCQRVYYKSILEELEFSPSQFLDFCIMCGTDYNKNIPNIGPMTAFKHMVLFGSIEKAESELKLDTSILKYKTARRLFTQYEKCKQVKITHCGEPDFGELEKFLAENNLFFPTEELQKAFVHNEIIFESSEEELFLSDEENKKEEKDNNVKKISNK